MCVYPDYFENLCLPLEHFAGLFSLLVLGDEICHACVRACMQACARECERACACECACECECARECECECVRVLARACTRVRARSCVRAVAPSVTLGSSITHPPINWKGGRAQRPQAGGGGGGGRQSQGERASVECQEKQTPCRMGWRVVRLHVQMCRQVETHAGGRRRAARARGRARLGLDAPRPTLVPSPRSCLRRPVKSAGGGALTGFSFAFGGLAKPAIITARDRPAPRGSVSTTSREPLVGAGRRTACGTTAHLCACRAARAARARTARATGREGRPSARHSSSPRRLRATQPPPGAFGVWRPPGPRSTNSSDSASVETFASQGCRAGPRCRASRLGKPPDVARVPGAAARAHAGG